MPTATADLTAPSLDFKMLFETTPAPYLVLAPDDNFTIVAVNDAYLHATMTDRKAILGKGLFEVFPDNPDDPYVNGVSNLRASLERVIRNCSADKMPIQKYDIPITNDTKKGFEVKYWSPINTPVLNIDKTVKYIIHRVQDVTEFMLLKKRDNETQNHIEQMQAEIYRHLQEIEQSQEIIHAMNQRYSLLMSILPVGIFHADLDGNCIYVNPQWYEITNIDLIKTMDKRWFKLVHPADADRVAKIWQQCQKSKSSYTAEFRFILPNKQERWVLAQIVPEIRAEKIQSYVGSITDITERKLLEEEQRKHVEMLSEIDKAKTAFFNNVSHELRTPLTLILGYIEDSITTTNNDYANLRLGQAKIIQRNAQRLLKLVNSLLEYSRIEAGRNHAIYEPTNLSELTIELTSVFRAAIEKAGLNLLLEIELLDEAVYVDKDMWEKIIFNLLSNAFKYTLEGSIAVILKKIGNEVRLQIKDTGFGIPEKELAHIFERFHRVAESQGRSHEGTGIGLALTQELVKLHGGQINVLSQLHQGTVFTVSLPLGKEHLPANQINEKKDSTKIKKIDMAFLEEAMGWLSKDDAELLPQPKPANLDIAKGKILVIDDNQDMRLYLKHILSDHWDVQLAVNGAVALEMIAIDKPDLILTDIMMPKIDGLQLIKAIRCDDKYKAIPIILLSARAAEESRIEGLEQGADDYLTKPFSAKELIAHVNKHLQIGRIRCELENEVVVRTKKLQQANIDLLQKINELKHSENNLLESKEGYRILAEVAPVGIIRFDKEFNILFINNQGCLIMALKADQIKNNDWIKFIHPEDRENISTTWRQAIAEKATRLKNDFRILQPNGTSIWVTAEIAAEYNVGGEITSYVGVITDISERKELERLTAIETEEKIQRHRAQEAENYRNSQTEFINRICHEIRNPLNGIYGNIDILNSEIQELYTLLQEPNRSITLTDSNSINTKINNLKDAVAAIKECAEHQKTITDEVLSLAKLDANEIKFELEPCNPKEIIISVITMFKAKCLNKGIQIDYSFPTEHICVKLDPQRIKEILINLVSNSLKFTHAGYIKILLKITQATISDIALQFSVQDTGIGINEAELATLFSKFKQASSSTYLEYGGSGLGLFITKKLVTLMGGHIEVESTKEQGTKFTFYLIAQRAIKNKFLSDIASPHVLEHSEPLAITSLQSMDSKYILIVEDNIINQKVLASFLKKLDCIYKIAKNGAEAVKFATEAQFDLVLMDIQMPIMNGIEATIKLRQMGFNKPIIGLSGNAQEQDKDDALTAGMNDYLVKPISQSTILDKIKLYLLNTEAEKTADILDLQEHQNSVNSQFKANIC